MIAPRAAARRLDRRVGPDETASQPPTGIPAMSKSRIAADIDLDADGRHHGCLRIPHSVHRSAYGWLPMPVASVRNGDGPCVLLMAGNHGDEYEGQVALAGLARTLEPRAMHGQIIVVPMSNYPAARAGRRTSPIDEGNLNRSFPGDADGTVTQMIAHLLESELMARADLVVDLHSGGSSLLYLPATQVMLRPDGSLDPRERELADAYGAPHNHVLHAETEGSYSSAAAARQGALYVASEFAGAGTVTPQALAICRDGLARMLHAFGVLEALPAGIGPGARPRYLEVKDAEHFVYASEDGVHEPLVELGDEVRTGDAAGAIHFPESCWREPVVEHFQGSGVVVCKRVPGRSERGDCLFHLASDWSADAPPG